MSRTFTFKIGDPSQDGHGWSEEQNYRLWHEDGSAVTDEALRASITVAQAALGFDLDELCEEYEDSYINGDQLEALIGAGFVQPEKSLDPRAAAINIHQDDYGLLPEGWPVNNGYATVNTFDFVAWMLCYGNPTLKIEAVRFESLETVGLHSFGYGLFST